MKQEKFWVVKPLLPPPPTKGELVASLLKQLSVYVDEYTVIFDGKVYSMKKQ